jgi:Tfp pilus assembly protein PilO
MSRPALSVTLIIISVAAFFTFINPRFEGIQALQNEQQEFDLALERARELQTVRDDLLSRYNTFDSEELEDLEKILPDNVDNVRLILDLDGIASRYGMTIKNVSLSEKNSSASGVQLESEIGEIGLTFNIESQYGEFKKFIRDLEQSLRIVDISSLSFSPISEEEGNMTFNITIKTYWLK